MSEIKYFLDIPRSISNKKQAWKAVQQQLIFIANTFHYCILDEIVCCDHIEYEIHNNENSQYFTNVRINIITFYMWFIPYVNENMPYFIYLCFKFMFCLILFYSFSFLILKGATITKYININIYSFQTTIQNFPHLFCLR